MFGYKLTLEILARYNQYYKQVIDILVFSYRESKNEIKTVNSIFDIKFNINFFKIYLLMKNIRKNIITITLVFFCNY